MKSMSDGPSPEAQSIEVVLERIRAGNLTELIGIWAGRSCEQWSQAPQLYRGLTETILGHGEPLLAYDVVTEALTLWPSDIRLRQLQGLALSRSGATGRANRILEELRRQGATDEETLGMLGRTYKDLAARAESPARENLLKRAAETYSEAYQNTGGYWTGINAATMNLLIGEEGQACQIAEKVREECTAELNNTSRDL